MYPASRNGFRTSRSLVRRTMSMAARKLTTIVNRDGPRRSLDSIKINHGHAGGDTHARADRPANQAKACSVLAVEEPLA